VRKYKEYTDEEIVEFAKEVTSLAGLLKKLGLKPAGGNYINLKRKLQQLKIDTAHWKGQGWNKDQQLKDYSDYSKVEYLKVHLIKKRGKKCEDCGLTEWKNFPILLEVHHCNGDRTDNKEENLQLLCPNCHSLTDNFRGRKLRPYGEIGKHNRLKSDCS
jgi:hypothetical protein